RTSRPLSRMARENARSRASSGYASEAGCPPPKPITSAPTPSDAGVETARSVAESAVSISQVANRVAGRVASAIGEVYGAHPESKPMPLLLTLRRAELRRGGDRRRHPRPGGQPRVADQISEAATRRPRQGARRRPAPDRPQQRRAALGHLLRAWLLEGQAVRPGPA